MTSNPYADLVNIPTIPTNTTSANATNIPSTSTVMITTNVESTRSLRVGHADFLSSTTTSLKNSRTLNTGFAIVCISDLRWHARRDLNPQPTVLETVALPIELLAYPTERCRYGLLLLFLMHHVFAALRAKLPQLKPAHGRALLVFVRHVVAVLALGAGH